MFRTERGEGGGGTPRAAVGEPAASSADSHKGCSDQGILHTRGFGTDSDCNTKAVSLAVSVPFIRLIMEAIIMGSNHYERRNLYSDDQLIQCYKKYNSQTKAAKELGVSRETVARAVRRAGTKLNGCKYNCGWSNVYGSGTPPKITDNELRKEAQTKGIDEIARKYNMSSSRVYRRAHNIKLKIGDHSTGNRYHRRAMVYGSADKFDDSITLDKIIERDNGICQICGKQIDRTLINGHIHKMYPTIDHIIPMSKGGKHILTNVQLAHLGCNAKKYDKTDNEKNCQWSQA